MSSSTTSPSLSKESGGSSSSSGSSGQTGRLSSRTASASAADSPLLELPTPLDDLATLCNKLNALTAAIRMNKSVAQATGFMIPIAPLKQRSSEEDAIVAEAHARIQFTEQQRAAYDDYKNCRVKPEPIDWSKAVDNSKNGSTAVSEEYILAINEIWQTDKATAKHAAWIAKNKPKMVSLISAVSEVQKACRKAASKIAISPEDLVEKHVVQHIDSAINEALESQKVLLDARMRAIEEARVALRCHAANDAPKPTLSVTKPSKAATPSSAGRKRARVVHRDEESSEDDD